VTTADVRRIHVLQVTHGAVWGGGERHILSLLEAFRDREQKLSLAVFTDGRLARQARRLGTDVTVIPKRFRGDPAPLWGLIRWIRRSGVDLVHTHMLSGNMYGRVAARLARTRLVTTLHYIDPQALPFLHPFLQRLFFDSDIRLSAICDRIITTSEHMRRELLSRGMNESKLVSILNGINPEMIDIPAGTRERLRKEFSLSADATVVGMAARLVPVKNFTSYLDAARMLLQQGLDATFMVIGDGPLRADLEAHARVLGIADRVIFTGFRDDIMELMSMIDLAVLSSNSETSAYGVSEAMAMGKPVVATAVGGVPELIEHGRSGWLCKPGDASALADGIRDVLSDHELANRLSVEAKRTVRERLSLDRMADELLLAYQAAMERRAMSHESGGME
jgi:glycosyltransferase involved in cell wall biosynthesis